MTEAIAHCLTPGDLIMKGKVRGTVLSTTDTHCFIKWDDGTYTERQLSDMKDIDLFEFEDV